MAFSDAIYLPQPDEPSLWRVEILGAGHAIIEPGDEYPPRQHPEEHYFQWDRGRSLPEFQAILITEGGGTIETQETGTVAFEAPFLFLLFPGVWHRYRPDPQTGWSEYWVAFDGPYPRELLAAGAISPATPFFQTGHSETLLAQFLLARDEAQAEALGFRRICAASIMQILALATTLPVRTKEESEPMRAVIRKASFLMRERADTALSPEDLADELNVGYTNFRRLFKKYTGMSPKRYHSQLRLQKAKTLLQDTGLNIGEIATALAFDTPFHFSSWFKKLTGESPSEWRGS